MYSLYISLTDVPDSCRFEHPGAQSSGRGQSRNPFESVPRDPPRRNAFGVPDQGRQSRGGDSYRPEPRRFDDDNRGRSSGKSSI